MFLRKGDTLNLNVQVTISVKEDGFYVISAEDQAELQLIIDRYVRSHCQRKEFSFDDGKDH